MSIHDKLLRIYGMSNPVMLEIIANIESGPDSRANSAQIPSSRTSTAPGVQHEGNHIQNSAFFPNFVGVAFDPSAIGKSDPKKHQFVPENVASDAAQMKQVDELWKVCVWHARVMRLACKCHARKV